MFGCHDVQSLGDDCPPLIAQNEIKRTFYFTGDLRVTGTRVTSISRPHTFTCQVYEVYPVCTANYQTGSIAAAAIKGLTQFIFLIRRHCVVYR